MVEKQCEILPGFIVAVEISHFAHRSEVVGVYGHPHKLDEVGSSLLQYLSGRDSQLALSHFNRMQDRHSTIWELLNLLTAEGLLR